MKLTLSVVSLLTALLFLNAFSLTHATERSPGMPEHTMMGAGEMPMMHHLHHEQMMKGMMATMTRIMEIQRSVLQGMSSADKEAAVKELSTMIDRMKQHGESMMRGREKKPEADDANDD